MAPGRYPTAALLLAALAAASCDEPPAAPSPVQPNITVIQQVNVGQQQPAPSPSPGSGTGTCVREAIDSVRVGPFGYFCPPGVTPPRNGSGVIPANCSAIFTATPKDQQNVDVPASLHGSTITWAVPVGAQRVRLTDAGDQPFNKNVTPVEGAAPGDVQITATVCGVTGTWNGQTTAASSSGAAGLSGAAGFEFVIQ